MKSLLLLGILVGVSLGCMGAEDRFPLSGCKVVVPDGYFAKNEKWGMASARDLTNALFKARQILPVVHAADRLQVIHAHEQCLFLLPGLKENRQQLFILCHAKDERSIFTYLRILAGKKKVRQTGEIPFHLNQKPPAQRFVRYTLPDLNQILPHIPAFRNLIQHLLQSSHLLMIPICFRALLQVFPKILIGCLKFNFRLRLQAVQILAEDILLRLV